MISNQEILDRIDEARKVSASLRDQVRFLSDQALLWAQTIRDGGKVVFFGNGGSAADAQHLVCELAGRFFLERKAVPALALTVNTSSITAIANDYSYDEIFARQLEGIGRSGDVAVGISTSGSSANVIRALEVARDMGIVTVGWTGRAGGRVRELSDHWLGIDSEVTPRIQEGHILAGHIVCELTERELFGQGS